MKEIPLTQGQVALVDDEDYDWLMQWKWCALWDTHTRSFRAVRSLPRTTGKRQIDYMHRVILGCLPEQRGDHIDHDTLNNQRYNLRSCTNAQNLYNQQSRSGSSSFKGVWWKKALGKWEAAIRFAGHQQHLGYFNDGRDAAQAYNVKALELFGNFALLNGV